MPTKITDHEERAAARLVAQYKGRPRIEALVRAHAKIVQGLEDAGFAFYEKLALATASGDQLDRLGGIVGQQREGRSDGDYRVWISARLALNAGSGTVPELADLLAAIAPAGATVRVEPYFPAGVRASILGAITSATLAGQLDKVLQLAKAGGVEAQLVWLAVAEADTFAFDGGTGLGFGDSADATVGGGLAGTT